MFLGAVIRNAVKIPVFYNKMQLCNLVRIFVKCLALLQCWISLASGGWDLCRLSLHEHKVLLLLGELQALLYQFLQEPPLTGF